MYSYSEAYEDCLKYFNNDDLAAKVYIDKYILKDNSGNILENTPEKTHRRLAKEFARVEATKFEKPLSEDEIFFYFDKFRCIIPQGSPIFAIGNDYQIASASNCFVVEPPEDSYGGICKTDQELAQISKRRGGVGVDLSKLRPTGSVTHNSSRTSTGIKTWMERYSNTIREVGQSGRRGALMLTLSVHHPDIKKFITAKNNGTDVTGANISSRLTDEFLNAVENKSEYELRFPIEKKIRGLRANDGYYDEVSQLQNANEIWDMIVENAWSRGEPGVLFWDNILRESLPDCYKEFKTVSTNPCGEITLSANDSCRLMLINLTYFVRNHFEENAYFDFAEFYKVAQIAQRLMDDMVDLELEKIDAIIEKIKNDPECITIKSTELELWKKIRNAAELGRRTGLGITGLGDTVAFCNHKYGTDESIEFIDAIYKTLKFGSYRSGVNMAKELGPFPVWNWENEKDNPFLNRIKDEGLVLTEEHGLTLITGKQLYEDIQKYGRRNIANLTNAPAGTTSIVANLNYGGYFGTTSGIEPIYTWKPYIRKKKGNPSDKDFRTDSTDQNGDNWMHFKVYHKGIHAWIEKYGEENLKSFCPYIGSSAEEIVWTQRVKLQAAAQKHIDHSISSTVNLPNDVNKEEVDKIYREAWKSGCKGITVYRDGCRTGVLVKEEQKETLKKINATKRPKSLDCDIYNFSNRGNKYTVIVGILGKDPYEVFCVADYIDKHKKGKLIKKAKGQYILVPENSTEIELTNYLENDAENALLRMISVSLRHGSDIQFIVEQLQKTKGDLTSFTKCIARALKNYIEDGKNSGENCSCGNILTYQEGCLSCKNCGYSKCN